jgi:hypothetical protein
MQQIARIRFGWVVYFAESPAAVPAVPVAGRNWFSVFGKLSPVKRCSSRREDGKTGRAVPIGRAGRVHRSSSLPMSLRHSRKRLFHPRGFGSDVKPDLAHKSCAAFLKLLSALSILFESPNSFLDEGSAGNHTVKPLLAMAPNWQWFNGQFPASQSSTKLKAGPRPICNFDPISDPISWTCTITDVVSLLSDELKMNIDLQW